PPVEVFNLEIDTEHVYHVGNGGVLVHNSCVGHGYGIFNNKTGEVVKFGISRAKKLLTKTGLSVRAQNQLTALASKLGIPRSDLSSVILRDNFKNAKALFQWEDEVVGIWRSWKNIPQLPFNLRPRGVPF
ncbi:MAG: hypothetical protein R3C01_16885, partial [Planctomycetaceae bacterium]